MQKKGKPESNSDPNPKQASQLNTFNTKFHSRDINHTFLTGTFCPGHLRALKTTYLVLDGPWISEVAYYNIPQDTLGTKTSKGLQWGRVKGLELRAIPILEPWEISPGGILDTL